MGLGPEGRGDAEWGGEKTLEHYTTRFTRRRIADKRLRATTTIVRQTYVRVSTATAARSYHGLDRPFIQEAKELKVLGMTHWIDVLTDFIEIENASNNESG